MPYKVKKIKKGGTVCFEVSGPSGIHAKCTTKKKAFGQVAIMKRSEQGGSHGK